MNKSASTTQLSENSILSELNQFPDSRKFWIAFSGGLDSCVLLHLFYMNKKNINQSIEAIYVNHGLQQEAEDWGEFCKKQCDEYGIAFSQVKISKPHDKGTSIEEWARQERYALINEGMNEKEVLFTAHHQDDQVETFFLQALRGAGTRGLSSMPMVKQYDNKYHARLLLSYSRESLLNYAKENKLAWCEDKSNADTRYDRNYFRHKLTPLIEGRWPAYRETISRLINHQNETRQMLDEIASSDLELASLESPYCLNLNVIKKISIARQKNLIFKWLKEVDFKTPASKNMNKIISDVIDSTAEKSPCVNWQDVEVRRYKDVLYTAKAMAKHDVLTEYQWKPEKALSLLGEELIANSAQGLGISKTKTQGANFIVRYRSGGETIRPENTSQTKTVKQLFQEKSVLPWMRDRIPLVFIDGELAVIPGICIDERYSATVDEPSWDIHWTASERVIQL